jgi:oxygen-independent coproporphyrinogen-3 oxidase
MGSAVPRDSLTPAAVRADAPAIGAAPGAGPSARARDEARIGLYVHVPFCAVRCEYCDFATGTISAAAVARYLGALEREITLRAEHARGVRFSSVFFGGGTPSALSARHFTQVWSMLRDHFELAPDAEITLEANPESVRPTLLEAWANAGVNRLSMGAQSFDPQELTRLGRIHDAEQPARAMALARAHGFRRLSLDLMFGFPGHRADSFRRTIETALAIDPEHLSTYCFIPEPETPMGRAVLQGALTLPEPDEQAELYDELTATLEHAGYACYEISNFCRADGEARHNLVYWLRRDYLGLGPSAHGLWRGVRFGNRPGLFDWAARLESGRAWASEEPETETTRAEEIVMLGLRLASGLRASDYESSVWHDVVARFGRSLERAVTTGRLIAEPGGVRIAPTNRFVSDDVIAWVLADAERVGFDSLGNRSVPSAPCLTPHFPAP